MTLLEAAGTRTPADRHMAWATVISVALVASATSSVVALVTRTDYDIWGALVVAPILAAASVPLLRRVSRGPDAAWLFAVLVVALFAKLLGTLIRYRVADVGGGDASNYDEIGRTLAESFRAGDWGSQAVDQYLPTLTGTQFIRLLTGAVYTVLGPTILGGFLLFSWLGFWGQVLFVCAFRLAVPEGQVRRYVVLVMFLPSLLFWPSSIGKESWMILCLGLSAYGAARLLTARRGGGVVLALGLLGTGMVRPHVTLILFVSLFVAYLLRRSSRPTPAHRLAKALGIIALLVAGVLVAGAVQDFFGLQGLDAEAVDGVLDETVRRSGQGGSEFDNVRVTSPAQYPGAVVQVLFRPFPHEASNAQAVVASIEGLLLLALFATSVPQLLRLPWTAVRRPYLIFAVTYVALFIVAFSAIGNFGILVRQRTQVYPFVLTLVALPALVAPLGRLVASRGAEGGPTEPPGSPRPTVGTGPPGRPRERRSDLTRQPTHLDAGGRPPGTRRSPPAQVRGPHQPTRARR